MLNKRQQNTEVKLYMRLLKAYRARDGFVCMRMK